MGDFRYAQLCPVARAAALLRSRWTARVTYRSARSRSSRSEAVAAGRARAQGDLAALEDFADLFEVDLGTPNVNARGN